jgi:hypothetical protein
MAGQKTISARYTEPPPIPVPTYQVSGELNPNATGYYTEKGTFDGDPYYQPPALNYYLWHHIISGHWVISTTLGVLTYYYWDSDLHQLLGLYHPRGHSTGLATVIQA